MKRNRKNRCSSGKPQGRFSTSMLAHDQFGQIATVIMNNERKRDVACRRCGNCCHVDVAAYVTIEDIRRWEQEGRHDILAHVSGNDVTWSPDGFSNRYGTNIRTCLMSCVYLRWHGPSASCAIYETRTKVCRSYVPGSTDLCPQHNKP